MHIVYRKRGSTANTLAAVTTFFNYAGFKSQPANYHLFADAWRSNSDIPLYTLELLLHGQRSSLNLPQSEFNLEPVRVKEPFFHKESGLNWIVKNLPDQFREIMWVDCDFIFSDYKELKKLPALLTQYKAVQCIKDLHYLDRSGNVVSSRRAIAATKRKGERGFHGGAWAASRDLWDSWGGLYSGGVIGGNDTVTAIASQNPNNRKVNLGRRNKETEKEIQEWAGRQSNYFQGRIVSLRGEARHMFHGDRDNRQYTDRHKMIRHLPPTAYRRDSKGFQQFNPDFLDRHNRPRDFQPDRDALLEYFASRREDD